jgi:hypothetical protein
LRQDFDEAAVDGEREEPIGSSHAALSVVRAQRMGEGRRSRGRGNGRLRRTSADTRPVSHEKSDEWWWTWEGMAHA